jgi:Papain-like cysteine protease AvrRpt2
MAFQSEFAGNDKLIACADKDIDHIGEQYAPNGPWVALIQKALNAWAAKQQPPVRPVPVTSVFGRETGDLVALYKTRHTPPILNYAGKIDRIVGMKTVAALDKELPPRGGGAPEGPTIIVYTVPGLVPRLVQPNDNACWATVACMLKSWRAGRSMTIREALTIPANRYYLDLFNEGKGLPASSHTSFAAAMGFRIEPLQNFPPESWLHMLQGYGPLGVVTFPPFHARVMIGMWGDGSAGVGNQVRLVDPADGQERMVLFPHFAQQFEAVANSPRAQVWHY